MFQSLLSWITLSDASTPIGLRDVDDGFQSLLSWITLTDVTLTLNQAWSEARIA